MGNTFIFKNDVYNYFDHEYNTTLSNERCVEVSISKKFIDDFSENLIEVGCVLPYYFNTDHVVYDIYDSHPKSLSVDAVDVDYSGKNVLSISTLEHVGTSDYGIQPKEENSGIILCERIIKESNKFFITWPLGYNKIMDEWIFNNQSMSRYVSYIKRNKTNKSLWEQSNFSELSIEDKMYGTYCAANTIVVITNS